jgi:hypothetical protein
MHAEPSAAKAQLLGNDGKRPPLGAQPTAFQRGVQPYDPDVLHPLNAGEPRLQRACTFQHGCQAPIGLGVGGAEFAGQRLPYLTVPEAAYRSPSNRDALFIFGKTGNVTSLILIGPLLRPILGPVGTAAPHRRFDHERVVVGWSRTAPQTASRHADWRSPNDDPCRMTVTADLPASPWGRSLSPGAKPSQTPLHFR